MLYLTILTVYSIYFVFLYICILILSVKLLIISDFKNTCILYIDLVHHTWNIYGVSALFDLKQDDIHFKLYSKKLREEIASNLSREEVTYDANFSIMENISRSTDENQSAIKVLLE